MNAECNEAEQPFHFLLRGPRGEPRRMRLYVQGAEDFWAAMMVGEDEPPPSPGSLRGVCFFGIIPEQCLRDVASGVSLCLLGDRGRSAVSRPGYPDE
jgi:hypothetical protein